MGSEVTNFLKQYSTQIAAIIGIAITITDQHFSGQWWLPILTGAGAALGVHASTYITPAPPAPPVMNPLPKITSPPLSMVPPPSPVISVTNVPPAPPVAGP